MTRPVDAALSRRIDARLLVVAGAACISFSAILMKSSGTSPATAGLFRCLLALPALVPLALLESRRLGRRPWRRQLVDVGAGVLLGVDLLLWGLCIEHVGAGIATVLVNVQVVLVPLLALVVHRERPPLRFAFLVPVMLFGVGLASGAIGAGEGAQGSAALWGALLGVSAGAAYAGYLFLLRGGGDEGVRHQAQPVLAATVGAAIASAAFSPFASGIDLTPGWAAFGWLLALAFSGQVCGWLLITAGLPRLRSNVGATLLLLQPVLAVLLGMVLLAERPTAVQLVGCGVVIVGVWLTSARRRARPRGRNAPRPAVGSASRSPSQL